MSLDMVFGFLFETKGANETKKSLADINKEMANLEKRNGTLTKEEVKQYNALKKQKEATDQLKSSNLGLAKSVVNMVSAYVGFKKILSEVFNFAKGGEDLMLLANSAGVSAEKLEQYGIALQNYGGSLSSATSTLSSLNQQLQDLRFGNGGAIQDVALRYGISLSGKNGLATGEEMLFNIARRMEGLGTSAQLDLGRKLGLDPSTISLLQNGVAGLSEELERASQFTLYSREDIENSRKFQQALRDLKNAFAQVWGTVSRFLMPALTGIMNGLTKVFQFLAEHRGLVLGLLGAIAVALGVIAVKALIAWAAVLGPILPIIAGITLIGTAIGLLIDDFLTFKEGGDSCIGWVAERFADFFLFLFESWEKVKEFFNFQWLVDGWNKIKSKIPFLGKSEIEVAQKGQDIINSTKTPLSTMSSSVIRGGDNSVRIDTLNVNTQATDVNGISKGISGALSYELEDVLLQNIGGAVA
jgi:hypothetical protein